MVVEVENELVIVVVVVVTVVVLVALVVVVLEPEPEGTRVPLRLASALGSMLFLLRAPPRGTNERSIK